MQAYDVFFQYGILPIVVVYLLATVIVSGVFYTALIGFLTWYDNRRERKLRKKVVVRQQDV